jgi:hypothetical protein
MYIGELEHGETGPAVSPSVKMAAQTADIRSRRSAGRCPALEPMTSLVAKVGSIAPLEPGERILCAAYVSGTASSIGAALIAVTDRRLLHAPRSGFLSRGVWRAKPLDEVRVESSTRRSFGLTAAHRFDVIDAEGFPITFELEKRRDAGEFRRAFERRLVKG